MSKNVAKIVLVFLIVVLFIFCINNSIMQRQCEESTYTQITYESSETTEIENIDEKPYTSSGMVDTALIMVEETAPIRIETISMDVPKKNSDFKAYMDYRKITDTTTKQWKLQQIAYTDRQGLRCIDGYYCVAMGSFYINELGDKFIITLNNDTTFAVIASEYKADVHTNKTNQYVQLKNGDINIIEFIVDENILNTDIANKGSIHYYENFSGNITKIERIINDTTS